MRPKNLKKFDNFYCLIIIDSVFLFYIRIEMILDWNGDHIIVKESYENSSWNLEVGGEHRSEIYKWDIKNVLNDGSLQKELMWDYDLVVDDFLKNHVEVGETVEVMWYRWRMIHLNFVTEWNPNWYKFDCVISDDPLSKTEFDENLELVGNSKSIEDIRELYKAVSEYMGEHWLPHSEGDFNEIFWLKWWKTIEEWLFLRKLMQKKMGYCKDFYLRNEKNLRYLEGDEYAVSKYARHFGKHAQLHFVDWSWDCNESEDSRDWCYLLLNVSK